jgi:hypothetical protein
MQQEPEPARPQGSASIYPYPVRIRRLAVLGMLLVWLAFNFPALAGKVRFPTDYEGPKVPSAAGEAASNPLDIDAYMAVYPWRHYLGASLSEGRIPWWDPYRFAGTPFAANISTGTFYPFNWAYAAGDILHVQTAISALSQLIALLGAFWFFSLLRLHPYASGLGAVTFAFSGFLTGWGAHDPVVNAVIWLPLALAGTELQRRGRSRLGLPVTAASLALSLLAGHVQFSIYVWMAAGLWAAVSMFFDGRAARAGGPREVLRRVGPFAGGVAASFSVAAGLCAVQLLGVAEFSQHIFRRTETYAAVLKTALPYRHLPTLLIPDYFGNPVDLNYSGPGINYTQLVLYMGMATLLLAVVGLFKRPGRATAYFAILGAVGILAALGTPFYRVLYFLVPGLSRTTHIARFTLFISFAISGLAAVGLHRLLQDRKRVQTLHWAVPCGVSAAGLVGFGVSRVWTKAEPSYLAPRLFGAMLFLLIGAGLVRAMLRYPGRAEILALLLVTLVAADLWVFGFRYHPFQAPRELYRSTPQLETLKQLPGDRPRIAQVGSFILPFNATPVHELYGLQGYDPFLPDAFIELLTVAEDQRSVNQINLVAPLQPETVNSPVMDLLGVRAFLLPSGESNLQGGPFTIPFIIEQNEEALPAAFTTRCWEVLPEDRTLTRLRQMSTEQLGSTVIVQPHGSVRSSSREECTGSSAAQIRVYEPERVVLSTDDSEASMLVLTDQWFAGWEATVDGEEVPVLKADGIFRAVKLPSGSHTVEFRFRPAWLPLGTGITTVTMLGVAAFVLIATLRRRGS